MPGDANEEPLVPWRLRRENPFAVLRDLDDLPDHVKELWHESRLKAIWVVLFTLVGYPVLTILWFPLWLLLMAIVASWNLLGRVMTRRARAAARRRLAAAEASRKSLVETGTRHTGERNTRVQAEKKARRHAVVKSGPQTVQTPQREIVAEEKIEVVTRIHRVKYKE